MILCVSLNPCLEINVEVDSLTVGMSHRVRSKRTFFTGKSLNVAIGLSRLGAYSLATGFMYEDNGRLFEQELHKEGVTYKFVWVDGRVKEVYKFVDRRSMLTEVVDEASDISSEKADMLVDYVKELSSGCNAVVISGDVAGGLTDEYFERIVASVDGKSIKVIDTEGNKLLSSLKYGVDLVKPNLDELQRTLGIKITDKDSMLRACNALLERGAKRVLLSLGKQGAVITDGNKRYYCVSVNVAMNSTAGAGDAMVAAATKALTEGKELKDILLCGVAAGTAAVTLPDSISFEKEKYEELLPSLIVKEI